MVRSSPVHDVETGPVLEVIAHPSPVGQVVVAATCEGVRSVLLPDVDPDEMVASFLRTAPVATVRWVDAPTPRLEPALRAIDAVLAGRPFVVPRQDVCGTAFEHQVWEAISRIPRGETRTYGDLARDIDRPRAVRAVGQACGANPLPILVPCHRVVGSRGTLVGFGGGLDMKARLLAHEGVLLT